MQNWKENNIWQGLSLNTIYNMDCIEGMKLIPDWSIDAIITDPPYWTTACKWDTVIPFDLMREQLKRIIKPNWAIVLFWSEPFSSALRMSNIKQYKYDWIWDKVLPTGFAIAKYQPMKQHENILIFGKGKTKYNPQKVKRDKPRIYNRTHKFYEGSQNLQKHDGKDRILEYYEPRSIQVFSNANHKTKQHPTQKPVELMEYLIKTYTNESETVLDFTMGSGTTAIACINTNRNFIWFELDEWYYNIANKRIQDRLSDNTLFS